LHCIAENPYLKRNRQNQKEGNTVMKKDKRHGQTWKISLVFVAVFAWIAIPFILQNKVEASSEIPSSTLTASLVSPSGSVNPHGAAAYNVYPSGKRELEVEAEDVNAVGATLTYFLNGVSIGQMTVGADFKAKLQLSTEAGQTVPVVTNGNTVTVRNGATMILSGVFGNGTPTPSPTSSPTASPTASPTGSPSPSPSVSPTASPSPSPSPTETPDPNAIFATLSGPTINGGMPRGISEYEVHSSRTELETRVSRVNLPIGTSLSVTVNGTPVGNIVLASGGEGRLRLRSDRGETVPVVAAGSTIQIKNGATLVLSGTYTMMSSPTPSPTGTPQATHFQGIMTRPNSTTVYYAPKGEIHVTLNATDTQATITGSYSNLTSNQTGAKITVDVNSAVTVIHDFGVIGGRFGTFAPVTINVTPLQVQQLRTGMWTGSVATVNNPTLEITGLITSQTNNGDFDGDGNDDFAVFRPSTGTWYSQNSAGFTAQNFGTATDVPVSADFDGDGKTDRAIFRNVNGSGVWEINNSSDGSVYSTQFGFATDTPLRGDFDGDGRNDIGIYRPSTGVWYVQKSNGTGFQIVQFGIAEDIPMSTDMDGDGKADVTVFRPSTGVWYWINSETGSISIVKFGQSGDKPVKGDFDGDGRDDISVYRPSTGVWYIWKSSDGTFDIRQFGLAEDIPVAGNYDGDTKTDVAVFRPSTGDWYIWRSIDNTYIFSHFGLTGDIPTSR
jgi:hypothetical protein